MRLSAAIRLSDAMKAPLLQVQRQLQELGIEGRYTPESQLHLTLAFIGEQPEVQPSLDALSSLSFSPFEVTLQGLGSFGTLWWAGIRESAPLCALAHSLRSVLSAGGIPYDDAPFLPHITLLRKASKPLPQLLIPPACMTVAAVHLLRSDPGAAGMVYTEVGRRDAQR